MENEEVVASLSLTEIEMIRGAEQMTPEEIALSLTPGEQEIIVRLPNIIYVNLDTYKEFYSSCLKKNLVLHSEFHGSRIKPQLTFLGRQVHDILKPLLEVQDILINAS